MKLNYQDAVKNNRSHNGFTLIELLVVVAIIAVLAAILFPVFARARENARRAGCMSNMKQLGLAMMQYSQDYDETMVPGFETSHPTATWPGAIYTDFQNNPNAQWYMILQPYIKSTQILHCPSASGLSSAVSYTALMIGYNVPTIAVPAVSNLGYDGNFTTVRLSEAARPSESIVLMENSQCDQLTTCAGSNLNPRVFTSSGYLSNFSGYVYPASTAYSPRHFDGMNFLFFDGHVKWLLPQNIKGRNTVLNDSPQAGWANW